MFHLHRNKRIIQLVRQGNGWVFELVNKKREDREHSLYWRFLAEHSELSGDPFFYANSDDAPQSDGAHRNRANYADHLNAFPVFKPLNEEDMAQRIKKIAEIRLSSVIRPDVAKFPDIGTVQVLAYHRIVKFRKLLDEVVGTNNRFWRIQRAPPWKPKDLTFEIIEPEYTAIYSSVM